MRAYEAYLLPFNGSVCCKKEDVEKVFKEQALPWIKEQQNGINRENREQIKINGLFDTFSYKHKVGNTPALEKPKCL
ncbi:MAG: hypothetical protein HC904_13195 [Blastochloris sp.]|nr:hypothetical protein [Blastochloris sp.]